MKTIILIVFMLLAMNVQAQTISTSKVTLKSGTVIEGVVERIDINEGVKMMVDGASLDIPMKDIQSVENISRQSNQEKKSSNQEADDLKYGEFTITDHSAYPDSITIDVSGIPLKMMLVRGGDFNMGFDGRGSRRKHSEPIHRVSLSSFYVSVTPVTINMKRVVEGKEPRKNDKIHLNGGWKSAHSIVEGIAHITGTKLSMITEAQWEYIAIQPKICGILEIPEAYGEWCYDFYEDYTTQPQVDPTGPTKGGRHINRLFLFDSNEKWNRAEHITGDTVLLAYRVVIAAKDIQP